MKYIEFKNNIELDDSKLSEEEIIERNKKLCERYPFLISKNRRTGKVSEDYDYSYTELSSMPKGWLISFGLDICEELREELIKYNYLDKYFITDIKEKYGILHWYDFGYPRDSKVSEIIGKYEAKSEEVCQMCGKPAHFMTSGWIGYYCADCLINLLNILPNVSEEEKKETLENSKIEVVKKKMEDI